MNNRLVAAIAAGSLAVGLLAGAAGAVLVNAGSANGYPAYAPMHGGNGGYGYGMMGGRGAWSYDDMLNEMQEHMGWPDASPDASSGDGS